ncbi:hypothetical protein ACFX2C_006422 [Malus domestica]
MHAKSLNSSPTLPVAVRRDETEFETNLASKNCMSFVPKYFAGFNTYEKPRLSPTSGERCGGYGEGIISCRERTSGRSNRPSRELLCPENGAAGLPAIRESALLGQRKGVSVIFLGFAEIPFLERKIGFLGFDTESSIDGHPVLVLSVEERVVPQTAGVLG